MSNYYQDLRSKVGSNLIFMPSVAGIIRSESGKILFQNKGNGEKWSLPAGAIELGEAPAEAVVREVWEETGLQVVPEKLLGVYGGKEFRYEYPNGHKVEYIVFVFDCRPVGGEHMPIDSETAELRYFSVEDRPELALPYPESIFLGNDREKTGFQWDEAWLSNLQRQEIVSFNNSEEGFHLAQKSFQEQKNIILKHIPEADIQHVGSSAVPGSLTKGDLDIQVRVSPFLFRGAVQILSGIYDVNEGSTQTDYFRAFKDDSATPPLGVQLTVINSDVDIFWKLREVLIRNEHFRREYDELKQCHNGRLMEDYRKAKDSFFQKLMASEEYKML